MTTKKLKCTPRATIQNMATKPIIVEHWQKGEQVEILGQQCSDGSYPVRLVSHPDQVSQAREDELE